MPSKTTKTKTTKKKPSKTSSKEPTDSNTTISKPEDFSGMNIELLERIDSLKKQLRLVCKSNEDFMKCFNTLQEFSETSIHEIDYDIRKKSIESQDKYIEIQKEHTEKIYNLEKKYEKQNYDLEVQYTAKKYELRKEFENYEYETAVQIIDSRDEINITKSEYEKLKDDLEDFKNNQDEREDSLRKELETNYHKEINYRLKTKELEFTATNATMKATIDQQQKEIQTLTSTIETLKDEISQQRELTRNVAEASQNAITQNYGK